MNWTDDYIDLPYVADGRGREGVDCWGLIHLIYRERLHIILPSKQGYQAHVGDDAKSIAAGMKEEALRWRLVNQPEIYDVILLRYGVLPCHVGIYVGGGDMLHICKGIDSTREALSGMRWGKRIEGFYRYVRE